MSFILDALKKSETERQQQSTAEFSSVPASSGEPNPARWLWLLGILLLINFAVLIGIFLKPGSPDKVADTATAPAQAAAVDRNFEEQVAMAVDNRAQQAPVVPAQPTATKPVAATPEPARSTGSNRVAVAEIPTIDELQLEGTLQIAQLHLDIHVFSEDPAERFVFINMNKHREGSTTPEGPVVREIRNDGVVLEYQGRLFLLPRE